MAAPITTTEHSYFTSYPSLLPKWSGLDAVVEFSVVVSTLYPAVGVTSFVFEAAVLRPSSTSFESLSQVTLPATVLSSSSSNPTETTSPAATPNEPKPKPPPISSSPSQHISSSPTNASTDGASATSTASQTPSPINSAQAAGLGSGAIAGIAIGCVIAGLIIGAVAALCLLRRRQDKHAVPEYLPMKYSSGEKVLPLAPVSDKLQLDQFLLDSKPDADIAAELQSLGQLIQQHVENNYHLQPVQRSPNVLAQTLVQLGLYEQDSSAAISLASLAVDPRTRWAALQHVISRVTFASSSLDGHSPISLLPPFSGAFVQTLPPIESHRGSSEGGYNVLSHPLVHSLT